MQGAPACPGLLRFRVVCEVCGAGQQVIAKSRPRYQLKQRGPYGAVLFSGIRQPRCSHLRVGGTGSLALGIRWNISRICRTWLLVRPRIVGLVSRSAEECGAIVYHAKDRRPSERRAARKGDRQ